MSLADTIKTARLGRYTQKEVALCVGISQVMYSNIERGRNNPSPNVLFKIARLLGLDLNRMVANVDVLRFYKIIDEHRETKEKNLKKGKQNV